MKIERESEKININIKDVESGTVGLFETEYNDGYSTQFTAILIKDVDYDNPILFDIEEDVYLSDVENYRLLKIYNDCKLLIP